MNTCLLFTKGKKKGAPSWEYLSLKICIKEIQAFFN